MEDTIRFFPEKYKNTYRHWMENIKDWCISRQLWWGQRIPAWHLPSGGFVGADTPAEALEKARAKTGDESLRLEELRQDDVAREEEGGRQIGFRFAVFQRIEFYGSRLHITFL